MYSWPERYPVVVEGRYNVSRGVPFDHIDHCINALRETVMCSADITPNVWQRDSGSHNISIVHFNTLHTCRNFDALRDWAKPRMPKGEDYSILSTPPAVGAEVEKEDAHKHKHEHEHAE